MGLGLTKRQRTIIRGTIHEARVRYAKDPVEVQRQAAMIAVMTMFPESGCRVLANANVPESIKYPHDRLPWTSDGLGHDHASCGSYQQQTGYKWVPAGYGYAMNQTTMNSPNGWGTPKELMDPAGAAGKFFRAMDKHHPGHGWMHKSGWVVAQNVQGSAYDGNARAANNFSSVYGGNYLGQRTKAIAAVRLLWPAVNPAKPAPVPPPPKAVKPKPKPKPGPKSVTVRAGQTLAIIAKNNGVKDWHKLVELNRKAHPSLVARPDFVKVGWKLRVR